MQKIQGVRLAGEVLKRRREALGLDIKEVADLLKIRAEYLNAIENDDLGKLPAKVYTLGYIRNYAQHLGVDASEVVEFYTNTLTQPPSSTILPVGYSQKRAPRFFYAISFLVLIAAASFIYYHTSWNAAPSVTAPSKPAAVEQSSPGEDRMRRAGQAEADMTHDLSVYAHAKTWMLVTLSDGRKEEALLKPGETRSWRYPGKLVMKVGNAGGVSIRFDGQDRGMPGAAGQVMSLNFPEDGSQ